VPTGVRLSGEWRYSARYRILGQERPGWCYPTGRCAYLPSVTCYRQSIKPPSSSFSLSLSLSERRRWVGVGGEGGREGRKQGGKAGCRTNYLQGNFFWCFLVYVCVCVCARACMHVCVCAHVYVSLCVNMNVCVCTDRQTDRQTH